MKNKIKIIISIKILAAFYILAISCSYNNKESKLSTLTNNSKLRIDSTSHYIGEHFGDGVIFHLFIDSMGFEHGLIVAPSDESKSEVWSNVSKLIGQNAQSSSDGLGNSNAIIQQIGHKKSAAALCLNSTRGAKTDWYLPSIEELKLLWKRHLIVNAALKKINGAEILKNLDEYYSSTEGNEYNYHGDSSSSAYYIVFQDDGDVREANKIITMKVRAIRSF